MTLVLTPIIERSLMKALEQCAEALEQSERYFDNRSDADCDQDGYIPNTEMILLSEVTQALNLLTPFLKQMRAEP